MATTPAAPAGVQLGVTDLTALVEQMEANAARLRNMLELATAPTWHPPGMAALEDVRAGDRVELQGVWREVTWAGLAPDAPTGDGVWHLCLRDADGTFDCVDLPATSAVMLQQRGDR